MRVKIRGRPVARIRPPRRTLLLRRHFLPWFPRGKGREGNTGFQVRKSQERKIWWEGLNGYRNKFRIPDAKHHNSWDRPFDFFRSRILETIGDDRLYSS